MGSFTQDYRDRGLLLDNFGLARWREANEHNLSGYTATAVEFSWMYEYKAVSAANLVIGNLYRAGLPEERYRFYMGQALCIRACLYFQIIRLWGDAPLVLEYEDISEKGRTPWREIAGHIVEARETAPIETTLQLADIVASAMPPAERRKNKNPSRRTFQALRIAVNHELDALEEGLDTIFDHLAPGGRLCVITFHSLEDRLVKNKFRRWSTACTCPPEFPVCVCGGKAKAKLITRKPIEADQQELEENRRSRSAHLRVLEKL